jgi:hypothetical protein
VVILDTSPTRYGGCAPKPESSNRFPLIADAKLAAEITITGHDIGKI